MKAIMTPVKPNPEIVTKFNLECNGATIGYIELNERETYHVVIEAGHAEGRVMLYQGHGATPELAIREMLNNHEKYATAQLRRIEELRKLLLSDEAE